MIGRIEAACGEGAVLRIGQEPCGDESRRGGMGMPLRSQAIDRGRGSALTMSLEAGGRHWVRTCDACRVNRSSHWNPSEKCLWFRTLAERGCKSTGREGAMTNLSEPARAPTCTSEWMAGPPHKNSSTDEAGPLEGVCLRAATGGQASRTKAESPAIRWPG